MKTVILAGGRGSRLSEETTLRPKPMVEIGGKPILWHILNIYSAAGFDDFVVALGYRGSVVKEYFLNYQAHASDLEFDFAAKAPLRVHDNGTLPPWRIALVDTGSETQTGGRIKRLARWIDGDAFMLTYGDGVADIDVRKLHDFHRRHGRLATVTAVRPPARFGSIVLDSAAESDPDRVAHFGEKPQVGEGWLNGGFFVLDHRVLDYIDGDDTVWEREPLERLAADGELMAYRHDGFWQPMDTLRERLLLEELWLSERAPWKVW